MFTHQTGLWSLYTKGYQEVQKNTENRVSIWDFLYVYQYPQYILLRTRA